MMFDRDQLMEQLRGQEVQITFTKADGTTRVMRATLLPHMLPPQKESQNTNTKLNQNVIRVWDMDKADWRSVRLDRVQQVRV